MKVIHKWVHDFLLHIIVTLCSGIAIVLWTFNAAIASQEAEQKALKENYNAIREDIKEARKENTKEHQEILEKIYKLNARS